MSTGSRSVATSCWARWASGAGVSTSGSHLARGGVRMLWKFHMSVPIPKLLNFEQDARAIIGERFKVNFEGAFAKASELSLRSRGTRVVVTTGLDG